MPHPADLSEEELLRQCTVRRTRRSGPGGQHRNKVETAVILEYEPTGVRAEANERRSQEENRQEAIWRLRVLLALTVRTPREAESPSELWRSRSRQGKLAVNPEHADFPSILAEALDVLAADHYDVPRAAKRLGVTSSQLLKLFRAEPRAFAAVNAARTALGMHVLK